MSLNNATVFVSENTDVDDDSKAERDTKRRLTSSLVDEPSNCDQAVQKQAKLAVSTINKNISRAKKTALKRIEVMHIKANKRR